MITENNQAEIRNYLLAKKLPLDILIEVQDHFQNQISCLMSEKNLSFENAFLQTQVLWTHELQMVRKSWFSFRKVPALVKKIQTESNRNLLRKTSIYAAISTLIMLVGAILLQREIFTPAIAAAYLVMNVTVFFAVLFLIVSNIGRRKTRASQYIYQNLLRLLFFYFVLGIFGSFRSVPTNAFKIIHDFANGAFSFSSDVYISTLLHLFFFKFVFFYIVLIFKEYRAAATKIKPYLA